MRRTDIGNQSRSIGRVALMRSQLRNPYDKGLYPRILIFQKQLLLDFTCTVKANPSGRADEHQHSNLAAGRVKSRSNWLRRLVDHIERTTWPVRTACDDGRQPGEQEASSL